MDAQIVEILTSRLDRLEGKLDALVDRFALKAETDRLAGRIEELEKFRGKLVLVLIGISTCAGYGGHHLDKLLGLIAGH
jgi:hypothetical protein